MLPVMMQKITALENVPARPGACAHLPQPHAAPGVFSSLGSAGGQSFRSGGRQDAYATTTCQEPLTYTLDRDNHTAWTDMIMRPQDSRDSFVGRDSAEPWFLQWARSWEERCSGRTPGWKGHGQLASPTQLGPQGGTEVRAKQSRSCFCLGSSIGLPYSP